MSEAAPRKKKRSFQDEERHWYERLRASGFADIENTEIPGRPLKRWDSFALLDERRQQQRVAASEYQTKAEAFYHSPYFLEVCVLVGSHGNAISNEEAAGIFELHLQGASHRKIASELRLSKTCVTQTLTKMKMWMRLL